MRPFASSISRVNLHALPNLCNKGLFVALVMGMLALNCSKAWGAQYVAEFQSMNIGSISWLPAETRTVSVTVKNAGTATWTDSSPDINIGIKWNEWSDFNVRVNAVGLAPGATGTYNFTITAPNSPNTTNNLSFSVVNEGSCWFHWNSGACGPGNSIYTSSIIYITPYVYGDNVWNVYGFNGGTIDLNGTYCGYYTEPLLSYNTTNRWSSGGSPSSASGWQGSVVPVDNHVVVSKRTNFPCGYYQIDIPGHDDDIRVYIDGAQVFEHVGCCDAHTNIWTGCLGSASVIEVRHREYGGGSYQALTFTVFSPVINGHLFLNGYEGSITTCPGNPVTISQTGGSYSGGHFYYWIGTDAGGGWPNSWDIWNQAHMDEYNPGSVTFNTPGKYVVHTNGHNWCCWGPGVTYYVTVDGTAPTHDAISVNDNCWVTNGTNTYTITIKSTESESGFGGNYGMMALINYDKGEPSAGGYFAWHPTAYVHTNDQMACSGGGFVSKASNWGGNLITLVSASTSVSGNQRTVNFVVRPSTSFIELNGTNKISMYTSDNCNNYRGWTLFDVNFTAIRVPSAPTGAITICSGGSATLTRGNAPPAGATYYWQTSSTGTNMTLGSGATLVVSPTSTTTYYVRPYSTSGCWGQASTGVMVTANPLPTFSVTHTDVSCFGGGDGSITVNILTGTAPYEYSNDNGLNYTAPPTSSTTHTFTGLNVAGSPYLIRVRDGNTCVSQQSCP